jgi:hypothetical protein
MPGSSSLLSSRPGATSALYDGKIVYQYGVGRRRDTVAA